MKNLSEIKKEIKKDMDELLSVFIHNIKNYKKYGKFSEIYYFIDYIDINSTKGYLVYINQAEKFNSVQNILNEKEKKELKDFIQENADIALDQIRELVMIVNDKCNEKLATHKVNAFLPYKSNYQTPINVFEETNNIDVGEHKTIIIPSFLSGFSEYNPRIEKENILCIIEMLKNVEEKRGPLQWLLVNYYAPWIISYIVKDYADIIKSNKDKRSDLEKEDEILFLVKKAINLQSINNDVQIRNDFQIRTLYGYQNEQSLIKLFNINDDKTHYMNDEALANIKDFIYKSLILERKYPSISAKALTFLIPYWKDFAEKNISLKIPLNDQAEMKKYFFKEIMQLKVIQDHCMKSQDDKLFKFEEDLALNIPQYTKVSKKANKNLDFEFQSIEVPEKEKETLFITCEIKNEELHTIGLSRDFVINTIEYLQSLSEIDYFIKLKKPKGSLLLDIKIPYSFDYTVDIDELSKFIVDEILKNITLLKTDREITLLSKTYEAVAEIREKKLFAILENSEKVEIKVVKKKI